MIPKIHPIDHIPLPEVLEYKIGNEVSLYEIRQSGCRVIKVELVFLAGRPAEKKKLVSTCCAGLMREGAGPYGSKEIAEIIDFYGASLDVTSSLDTITVRLVCLKKYLGNLIELVSDVLNRPWFKEEEFRLLLSRRIERLKLEISKNEVVSYRQLTESIFGYDHPYGYNSSESLYNCISLEDIREHYKRNIHQGNVYIFAAGDISDKEHNLICEIAQSIPVANNLSYVVAANGSSLKERKLRIKGSDSQSSVKIGRRLFKRNHPDYPGMLIVNALLGGYFGSRLVTRLREELGLTYGIYSSIDNMLNDGFFMISTEVTNDNVDRSLKEIYIEMERLQSAAVPLSELDHVKKYLMGSYLNLFDGTFNSIRAIKSLVLSQIPISDLGSLINISKIIGSEQIQNLACKYFNRYDFWEVVVGSDSNNTRE